jgi:hypothetical protein
MNLREKIPIIFTISGLYRRQEIKIKMYQERGLPAYELTGMPNLM